jgi:glycosyltransferase involved in cell wall biosynthesis
MPLTRAISAVVPARNEEANIARCVESLAAQPQIAEIIVVDDQSTDRTATILDDLAKRFLRLCIVQGEAPSPGWTGKNNALSLGVAQAHCEWLLFTDADVEHLPGSAARALGDAAEAGATLVSYSPEQETHAWWERAAIPFIYCRLSAHFSYERVSDPAAQDAAANGQYLLIRREVYEAIGGHEAVRSEVVEDVALARRAKQAGFRLNFARGEGIARTRMYRTVGEMWEGWTKNLYPLIGGRPWAVMRELLAATPWFPVGFLLLGAFFKVFFSFGLILLLVEHLEYGMRLRRNRYPASRIIYYLPASLWYAVALLGSTWKHVRGSVSWKGREVPVVTR